MHTTYFETPKNCIVNVMNVQVDPKIIAICQI